MQTGSNPSSPSIFVATPWAVESTWASSFWGYSSTSRLHTKAAVGSWAEDVRRQSERLVFAYLCLAFEYLDSAMPTVWTSTVPFLSFLLLLLLPVLVDFSDTWIWLIHTAVIFSSRGRSLWLLFFVVSDDRREAPSACDSPRNAPHRSSASHLTPSEHRYSLKLPGECRTQHPPKTELLLKYYRNGKKYFYIPPHPPKKTKTKTQAECDERACGSGMYRAGINRYLMSLRLQEEQMLSPVSAVKVIWE